MFENGVGWFACLFFVCLFVCLFVGWFACLFVFCLFVCVFVSLFVCFLFTTDVMLLL